MKNNVLFGYIIIISTTKSEIWYKWEQQNHIKEVSKSKSKIEDEIIKNKDIFQNAVNTISTCEDSTHFNNKM